MTEAQQKFDEIREKLNAIEREIQAAKRVLKGTA